MFFVDVGCTKGLEKLEPTKTPKHRGSGGHTHIASASKVTTHPCLAGNIIQHDSVIHEKECTFAVLFHWLG